MTSRISSVFANLARHRRKALIPFVMAGDPDMATSERVMQALVKGGADIIEVGVPFSDPMADGPVIQHAAERALKQGVTLGKVLQLIAAFRKHNTVTPIVLMGYTNPIESLGYANFAQLARESGVDGVLVVDTPPEESQKLHDTLRHQDLDLIFLLSPTSSDERCAQVASMASGYIYYISLTGVTGAHHVQWEELTQRLGQIRKMISIPLNIGFGIHDGPSAIAAAQLSDGVIIGSRLIATIQEASLTEAPARACAFVQDIRTALDRAFPQFPT